MIKILQRKYKICLIQGQLTENNIFENFDGDNNLINEFWGQWMQKQVIYLTSPSHSLLPVWGHISWEEQKISWESLLQPSPLPGMTGSLWLRWNAAKDALHKEFFHPL